MGSAPSTPSQEGNSDPWWSIENQTLELNPSEMNSNIETNAAQSQETNANDESDRAIDTSVMSSESEPTNESIVAESIESNETNKNDPENSDEHCTNSTEVKQSNQNQSLEEFKEELRIKRELRKCAISELRNEISNLRHELAQEKSLNKKLMAEKRDCRCFMTNQEHQITDDHSNLAASTALRQQLSEVQYSLQLANAEILSLTTEVSVTKRQTQSLKDVVAATKQMLEIRESELNQLKAKLREIENSLSERETKLMSENLRQEYDRQLANIRHLKALYEERSRISAAEKENLNRQLETSRAEYSAECEKNKNLSEHITSLETDLKSINEDLFGTREQLAYYKAENRNLHEEMTVINQLFSQLLGGFSGNNDIDIDRLTHMLEENRDLIKDITSKECCKEGAAQIPKLLLDIITHKADENFPMQDDNTSMEASTSTANQEQPTKLTTPQEIVNNLPKVWRVLIELLNHQKLIPVQIKENNHNEYCYKSVETPAGPKMELSLSKTYIRLKDLILEKKFLQKETKKLKNLNSHLENRLGEQENRLGAVTIELNKTWNLVGRMQRQHRQLHTHEQVLRYQLQQKRRMLSNLKVELEYCRQKWALAKEKNNESQIQWEVLRAEFRSRKSQDSNNSIESGYSDGPASEEDDIDDENVPNVTKPYARHRANKEKFLMKINEQKVTRVHSVSPKRCIKVGFCRRNSDSHVTQFATEEFDIQSDVAEPIIQTNCTRNCAEHCVLHSIHFENDAFCTHHQINQIKIIEPIANTATVRKSQVQKLVESKASKSKTKTCFELRKIGPSAGQNGCETLEQMFMRLSGQKMAQASTSMVDKNSNSMAKVNHSKRDLTEHQKQSMPQISCPQCRIESECQPKVSVEIEMNINAEPCTSNANDTDGPSIDTDEAAKLMPFPEPEPSTSTAINVKNDEDCLTQAERSYTQRRDERLKRLEAESEAFIKRMKSTNRRTDNVENKLEYLHGRYGSESALRSGSGQHESDVSSADAIDPVPNVDTEDDTVPIENPSTNDLEENNETDNGPPTDFIE